MKVWTILRGILVFNFVSLVACQECQDKFKISRFGVQRSLSQQIFLIFANIGIRQCSRECLIRTKCKADAYNLGNFNCYLGDDETLITASLYPEDLASPRSTLVQFENQLLKSCLRHSCHESSVCIELSSGTSKCVSFLIPNTTNSGSAVTTQEMSMSTSNETTIQPTNSSATNLTSTLTPYEDQNPALCGNLPKVTGANTPTSTERSVGTILTYNCQAGLVTKGKTNTTCQENGQWSALSLICTICDTTYFVFNENLNFCYRIETSVRNTYEDAILHCNSMGGKLAKVDSSEKILAISLDLTFQFFVDGTDEAEDRTWVHSDGTAVNMDLFKNGYPKAGDTNCLSVRADIGKTLDVACTLNKYSICEQS